MDNKLRFYKYQGTGNDFVIIDNRNLGLSNSEGVELAVKLCDRKFGVGSDGLILLQDHQQYDFEMVFFNPDGSQSMCGNGSRCAVRFAEKLGMVKDKCSFISTDGLHHAIIKDDVIKLSMHDLDSSKMLEADQHFEINTGSPHFILFVSNLTNKDVKSEGASIRYRDEYGKAGINVNFVEKLSASRISVRTYERGVEDETLSCGTGVTAAAVAHALHGGSTPVEIQTKGGNLKVYFSLNEKQVNDIYLEGPAEMVFQGEIAL